MIVIIPLWLTHALTYRFLRRLLKPDELGQDWRSRYCTLWDWTMRASPDALWLGFLGWIALLSEVSAMCFLFHLRNSR